MLSMSCSFLVPSLTRHGLSSPGLFREAFGIAPNHFVDSMTTFLRH